MTTTYAVMGAYQDQAETFRNLDDAVGYLDAMNDETLRVFRMEPLPESSLWDWSTRPAGADGDPKFTYTNEAVAKSCVRDGQVLVKRRRGTSVWVAA